MRKEYTKEIALEDLMELYGSVGWSAYTQTPQRLAAAVAASTYVVSIWDDVHLVGLARCLSDDVSVVLLQDLLVAPSHQRRGLGRMLLEDCLARFRHVGRTLLLTDDTRQQLAFYRALGFDRVGDGKAAALNAYLRR